MSNENDIERDLIFHRRMAALLRHAKAANNVGLGMWLVAMFTQSTSMLLTGVTLLLVAMLVVVYEQLEMRRHNCILK